MPDFRDQLKIGLSWQNAKFVSIFIVVCCVTYNYYINAKDRRCYSTVLNPKVYIVNGTCTTMKYKESNIDQCLTEGEKKIIFIGDSNLEKVKNNVDSYINSLPTKHDHSINIQFEHEEYIDLSINSMLETIKADLVVLGFSKNFEYPFSKDKSYSIYRNVSGLTYRLSVLSQTTPTIWLFPRLENMGEYSFLSNLDAIEKYEHIIYEQLKGSRVKVWDTTMVSSSTKSFHYEIEVLLNILCNKHQKEPEKNLCCAHSGGSHSLIYIFLLLLLLVFSILMAVYLKWESIMDSVDGKNCNILKNPKHRIFGHPSDDILEPQELPINNKPPVKIERRCNDVPLLILKGVIIFGYFYVCDRTDLFAKGTKSYSTLEFVLPLLASLTFGFAFRNQSKTDKFLNREITDEWKGWMQVTILIYHITGASSVLPIYMNIRILVSSYLFMTGFGNFCYYWKGGAMSLWRYSQVMVRMNLLTIMLCVVMQRPYQFYYFVPLVSFWYTVLYLVLLTPPNIRKKPDQKTATPTSFDTIMVLIKFAILIALITALSFSRRVFDTIFTFPAWSYLFELPGQTDYEWWFRWQIDRYSIIYGVLFGLAYLTFSPSQSDSPDKNKLSRVPWIKYGALTVVGIGLISSYYMIFNFCSSKITCNVIHPYIVLFPILGYIVLRNISPTICSKHSEMMFAAGKISLELFICQYHIWLASDTRGRLLLIPGSEVLNLVATTFVFICVAHEVNEWTGQVAVALLPKDNSKILRNLFAFFVCIALSIYFT